MEGQVVKIGTVAAQNIARSLGLSEEHAPAIESAIEDEIAALSAHFALAFADIQESYRRQDKAQRVREWVTRAILFAIAFWFGLVIGIWRA